MKNIFQSLVLLHYPFRVFFWLTGLYGVVMILAWMGYLFGGMGFSFTWSPLHWHSHEMLFGWVAPAIAGFILTAMCNWTGAPPLQDGRLFALASVWLAGRIAMWSAAFLSPWVIALVDGLFLIILAVYVSQVLLKYGNKRNLVLAAIILVMALANLTMHAGFITGKVNLLGKGQLLAMNLVAFMMVVIGGRLIPLFTGNWLRRQGLSDNLVRISLVEKSALLLTGLLILVELFTAPLWGVGSLALVAGLANGVRVMGWRGWKTCSEPLLWILHLGYAWIAVALILKGLAAFALVSPASWQHALGTGAMATLILGLMTRVSLGHTGRPLQLPDFAVLIYLAVSLAAVARVMAALQWIDYRWGLTVAAAAWTAAFALFMALYWTTLTRPRVDGRPG